MTHAQFAAAVAKNKRVRLKDRTRTFYVYEWYDPIVNDDRTLAIDTHTGERHQVDEKLLEELTTEPATLTVAELREQLARYPGNNPVVLYCGHDVYGGITPESIAPVQLRPKGGKQPRQARYAATTFAERYANDAFEAITIGHVGR